MSDDHPTEESPYGPGEAGLPRIIAAEEELLTSVLDQDALRVISRLQRNDHEAYLVGGCVRDLLVGRIPKDFDVATSAHPRQVKRLFRNGRIIGRRFRLVHIYYGSNIVETATFRREPAQERDGDDDDSTFQELLITEDNEYGTAAEDARRRDFTVNGIFLDPNRRRILDYVGGLEDLEARTLRTIGDPRVRLAEDPVRILRAIKFATRLGFRIEPATWDAMCELTPQLALSAPPRVLEEILRLMRSGTSLGAMRMLRQCGALRIVLPAIDDFLSAPDPYPGDSREGPDELRALLEALDFAVHDGYDPSTALCVALLFLPVVERELDPDTRSLPGAPGEIQDVAEEVLEPLARATRLSRRDAGRARRLIALQRRFTQTATKRFRPLHFMRGEDFPEALMLYRLRCSALGEGWDIYEGWRARYQRALEAGPEEFEAESRSTRRRRRRPRRKGRSGSGDGDDDPPPAAVQAAREELGPRPRPPREGARDASERRRGGFSEGSAPVPHPG